MIEHRHQDLRRNVTYPQLLSFNPSLDQKEAHFSKKKSQNELYFFILDEILALRKVSLLKETSLSCICTQFLMLYHSSSVPNSNIQGSDKCSFRMNLVFKCSWARLNIIQFQKGRYPRTQLTELFHVNFFK